VRRLPLALALLLATEAAASPAPPHTCRWAFPGGAPAASSSCAPPAVRYAAPGDKRVTLTVCAADGRCTTVSKQITILDPRPSVTRLNTDPPEPYVGDVVRLTAATTGKPPFSWLWTLPGSATARSPQAVLRTARLAPGVLPIKLRLSNTYGASTRTFYVRLQSPKPVLSSLGLSSTTPVLGSLLRAAPTVSGRPPLTYQWTLDGRALSAEPALAWQVSGSPGPHSLALRVTNTSGSASLARTITVLQPLIRYFRPVCPNLLCLFPIHTAVAFDLVLDPSAQPMRYEYDWVGNGPFTESSSAPVSLHIYTEPGNYRPRVRITTAHGAETRLASQFLLVTR